MEENNTKTVDTTVEKNAVETAPAIDFKKLDNSTREEEQKSKEPTVEELKALLAKAELEKKKIKESFDKKASEKAAAEKKAKELAEKANEPAEENARLKQELEDIKRENMKTSLTFTLSKEWGVSDDITSRMVSSIFSDETGGFVEDSFRAVQLELIKSVREQAKKEGYEERDREIANGKPRSFGNNQPSNPFSEKMNKYKR